MINTLSIQNYLDALASNQPTPGGGAAAALTGAQGVALLCMVCRLTLSKKRFAAHEPELSATLTKLEEYRQHCLCLAQKDIEIFKEVIAAYQLPKNTEATFVARNLAIQLALKAAAEVPLELWKICNAILPLAEQLYILGNPNVKSDVIVANHLLNASLLSAKANVEVNLEAITDQDFCQIKRAVMATTALTPEVKTTIPRF